MGFFWKHSQRTRTPKKKVGGEVCFTSFHHLVYLVTSSTPQWHYLSLVKMKPKCVKAPPTYNMHPHAPQPVAQQWKSICHKFQSPTAGQSKWRQVIITWRVMKNSHRSNENKLQTPARNQVLTMGHGRIRPPKQRIMSTKKLRKTKVWQVGPKE